MISHIIPGISSSLLTTSLLKELRYNDDVTTAQLNKLFDIAYTNLNESHHFILHYAINLQHRGSINDLEKAERLLKYADTLIYKRDSKLIHRRGVINFELAKQWYKKEKKELIKTERYLNEARELFEIKKLIDPCSSYSYFDLLRLELWSLERVNLNEEEELTTRIKVEENFDVAERTVTDYKYRILSLKNEYQQKFLFKNDEKKYLDYLEDCYGNSELRPYALILLFNFYLHNNQYEECQKYLDELEYYKDINDVMKLLFKYYGRNLNIMHNRLKFYELIREYPNIEDTFTLRFNYFNCIASAYNKDFPTAFSFISNINDSFNYLNPDFQLPWKETDTDNIESFQGVLIKTKKDFKAIKIPSLARTFYLIKKKNNFKVGKEYTVNLYFYLTGIKAEIIDEV